MTLKKAAVCLLAAALCITTLGCSHKKGPLDDLDLPNNDQAIIPEFTNPNTVKPKYTPVYASSFGDTIILATLPVEEWHSMESDCPPREISNGGRVKCNGEHEDEVPITKVLILDDLIPRVCSGWFRDMYHLEKIDGLEKIQTHQVTDMSYMFYGCENLTELDLSTWDVSNVTDMTNMFTNCYSLDDLPAWANTQQ